MSWECPADWTETKSERIQPLRPFTSESRTVSCPCKENYGLSEVAGSSAGCDPSFLLSLCLWRISGIVLPQAGPAGIKLHSSAAAGHSGDLWLALPFFYLNNSPALALKLLSSTNLHLGWHVIWPALDVMFASRYQFLCVHSTQKFTLGQQDSPRTKLLYEAKCSETKQYINDWHNDILNLDNLIWSHVHFSFSNFKQIITLESQILLIPLTSVI